MTLLLLATACAAPPPVKRQRFFWPIGSDEPKLEYIGFYQSDYDVREGGESPLVSTVFGKVRPKPLFKTPFAVASDGQGRVFVSDSGLNRVFVLDLPGHDIRSLKNLAGEDLPIIFAGGLEVSPEKGLWVADSLKRKILRFGSDERLQREFGKENLLRPTGLAFDADLDRLYVVDTDGHRLAIFDGSGTFLEYWGERGREAGQFNFPTAVDVGPGGEVFVLDALNARVQVFDSGGNFLRQFGERGTARGSFQMAKSLSAGADGLICVTDSLAHHFVIFNAQGDYLLTVGGKGIVERGSAAPGGFYFPTGIDIDENGTLWLGDTLNGMIQRFQFLTAEYLQAHPILQGETYLPPAFSSQY